jgi:hypothetical protein
MRKKPANRSMLLDEKHTRRVRDAFVSGILVCIAVFLIFLIIRITKPTRVVSEQVARSEKRLRELLSTQAELKSMRDQADQDRNAVDDFLQHCRSAEDIPDFQGEHVIAYRNVSRLACYVPEGKHQLEISAVWELKPTNPPQNQPAANEPKKEKTWVVSLSGNTGYVLEVVTDPEAQLVRWELSANNPEFESRKETVLAGDFELGSYVTVGRNPMVYPNQVQEFEVGLRASAYGTDRITQWEEYAKERPTLGLFGRRWKSKTGSGTEIRISAKLFSEGPAHVSATDAVSIITLQRSDLLMPYKGGGKYELRAPK